MIVGQTLFHALFLYVGLINPFFKLAEAHTTQDVGRLHRWGCFLFCVLLLVVPLLYIPSYVPFRNDLILVALGTFSACDAGVAVTVLARYLEPWAKQLETLGAIVRLGVHRRLHVPAEATLGDTSDDESETEETTS